MSAIEDVLHKLIDVAAGRANLPGHEADAAHEAITPGYTAVEPSAEDVAAAEKILADQAAARAKREAAQPPADPVAPSAEDVATAERVLAAAQAAAAREGGT